jgi:hypothetical protein
MEIVLQIYESMSYIHEMIRIVNISGWVVWRAGVIGMRRIWGETVVNRGESCNCMF